MLTLTQAPSKCFILHTDSEVGTKAQKGKCLAESQSRGGAGLETQAVCVRGSCSSPNFLLHQLKTIYFSKVPNEM